MRFRAGRIPGVWALDLDVHEDARGCFARSFCEREFGRQGFNQHWPQTNFSHSPKRGTLRGLHFQDDSHPEIKLITCAMGEVFDILLDVRRGSPARGRWEAFRLGGGETRGLYVPAGVAHGFQCLSDDCVMIYQMSEPFDPKLSRGVRWDDPELAIPWPIRDPLVSEGDRSWPRLRDLS